MPSISAKMPVVILISGTGRNLQVFLDEAAAGRLSVDIRAVISNRPDAGGLQRATDAGIPTAVVDHQEYPDRESFDRALAACVDGYAPELVVLAGFMRILTSVFVQRYTGRMLNVHPSLLPAYRGLNTYQRALDDGAQQHGVSIHFVTEELDGGPVVLQASTDILPDDDAEQLAQRVHQQELVIYPVVVQAFAEQRLQFQRGVPCLDGEPLLQPIVVHEPAKCFANDYTKSYAIIFQNSHQSAT